MICYYHGRLCSTFAARQNRTRDSHSTNPWPNLFQLLAPCQGNIGCAQAQLIHVALSSSYSPARLIIPRPTHPRCTYLDERTSYWVSLYSCQRFMSRQCLLWEEAAPLFVVVGFIIIIFILVVVVVVGVTCAILSIDHISRVQYIHSYVCEPTWRAKTNLWSLKWVNLLQSKKAMTIPKEQLKRIASHYIHQHVSIVGAVQVQAIGDLRGFAYLGIAWDHAPYQMRVIATGVHLL